MKWSTLGGASSENQGAAPDVEVPQRFEEQDGRNRALAKALDLLRGRPPLR